MTERDMLLKKIGTLKFAVTDIDLFLDTHPGDKATMKKREEYLDQLKPLVREYE
ncbi:MAG: spore coat protein CotJB [Ruminococcus sp.]|nr:spore coat protein CotJB [Ruminococcus sp.]